MTLKLIIASDGFEKTTFLVEQALKISQTRVLITTYTHTNESEIRCKIIEKKNFIPANITVQTWFEFLLQHGVRPYQGYIFEGDIKGIRFCKSISEKYLDEKNRIYSDKISTFTLKCNEYSNGKVIDRLSRIYSNIFIDESQYLKGDDLGVVRMLENSPIQILM